MRVREWGGWGEEYKRPNRSGRGRLERREGRALGADARLARPKGAPYQEILTVIRCSGATDCLRVPRNRGGAPCIPERGRAHPSNLHAAPSLRSLRAAVSGTAWVHNRSVFSLWGIAERALRHMGRRRGGGGGPLWESAGSWPPAGSPSPPPLFHCADWPGCMRDAWGGAGPNGLLGDWRPSPFRGGAQGYWPRRSWARGAGLPVLIFLSGEWGGFLWGRMCA